MTEDMAHNASYDSLWNRNSAYSPYRSDSTDRLAIFLDVLNVLTKLHEDYPDAEFDFRKMLMDLIGVRKCVAAIAVDGTFYEDEERRSKIQCMLKDSGFRPDLVPASNNSGKQEGTDVELALLAYKFALERRCDCITLVTGDGDFKVLVKRLQEEGVIVNVVSFDESLSRCLKRTADSVFLLNAMPLRRMRPANGSMEVNRWPFTS
ncbi:MAG: NYN domain-containing protein [Candidatus Methanomethylophilaceae archaeon]|nr:NYN domain-containing protein [Candidatus Methanomethylophilaceae archaeon]MBR6205500.1 NYN domain-containing protein [Candidatus Methanomethylophilaceae archaeon]